MTSKAYELEASVVAEIRRCYEPCDFEYVKTQLESTPLCWDSVAPPPRVHIAVIWLSEGCRAKFDDHLEEAVHDWRNTLIWAGLADEDWKEVLKAKKIDCSGW